MKYNLSFFDPSFCRSTLRTFITICVLAKLADAVGIPYTFSHEGNNYALNTTATGDSNNDFIAKEFFKAVATIIENGTACGTVLPPTANITEYALAWVFHHFGGHNLTLLREASQEEHLPFEPCAYNQSVEAAGPFAHQFRDFERGTAAGAVVIALIATLILACNCGLGANLIAKCCAADNQQDKRNYQTL